MFGNTSRRSFLKGSAAVGAGLWLGGQQNWVNAKSPNGKLAFACIGVGGKGGSDTAHAAMFGEVVAICDIDDERLNAAAQTYPNAKKFNDYRELFSQMGDKVDAATVSTADHMHAPIGLTAMKLGKHVYVQKPMTWCISEARAMRETAAKMKVATQMGNQGTAMDGFRQSVEIIRSGAIGPIREVHAWTDRAGQWWPQGVARPTESQQAPSNVHWDLFLGVAPERPYHKAYHPFAWRGWLDFGTGAIGDMACHVMNMAVMALELYDPVAASAESSGIMANETYPSWSIITLEFGPRGKNPPCKMVWYDGGKLPDSKLFEGKKVEGNGLLFIGDGGKIYCPDAYGAGTVLLPENKFVGYKAPTPSLPRITGIDANDSDIRHFKEFADACHGGPASMSNFDYAARLTETALMGILPLRAGKKIEWNAKEMKVTNEPSANQWVSRKYRNGWTV